MPPVWPMIQLFGSGTPHNGSTWNFGGSASAGCASAAATRPAKASMREIIGISSLVSFFVVLERRLTSLVGAVQPARRRPDRAQRNPGRSYHAGRHQCVAEPIPDCAALDPGYEVVLTAPRSRS